MLRPASADLYSTATSSLRGLNPGLTYGVGAARQIYSREGESPPSLVPEGASARRRHYSALIAAPIGSLSVGLVLVRSGSPSAGNGQVFVVLAADPEVQP
jgi:hypothetical protein